jgi:DNA-binding NarL/FixJ family response regulator
MAEGFPKTKIAARLRIRSATVERNFGALMSKLSFPSIANLAAYAVASGYAENDVDLVIN